MGATYYRNRYGNRYGNRGGKVPAGKRREITNKYAGECAGPGGCGGFVSAREGLAVMEVGATEWYTRHSRSVLVGWIGKPSYVGGCPPIVVKLADPPPPVPTSEQITVTWRKTGRDVILLPNEVAARLRVEIQNGWHEWVEHADGVSKPFTADSWVGQVTIAIAAAFAASPVPTELDGHDRASAAMRRQHAAEHRCARGVSVAGVGDWDADERDWINHPQHAYLHVHATPEPDGNNFRYGG